MKNNDGWVGCWSDDAESVRDLVRDLKKRGIRAKTDDSVYVGHKMLKVARQDVPKAKRILPRIDRANGAYIADECLL